VNMIEFTLERWSVCCRNVRCALNHLNSQLLCDGISRFQILNNGNLEGLFDMGDDIAGDDDKAISRRRRCYSRRFARLFLEVSLTGMVRKSFERRLAFAGLIN
jgi:hypothetical protein